MYLAELHGKLSSNIERKEDLLTSNVFSFFKYSHRKLFLRELLTLLELNVEDEDLDAADFVFWPNYDDNTQPDLVVIIGKYYLLWEAKFFSEFDKKEVKTKSQIIREIIGGLNEGKTIDKEFYFIAITADYIHDTSIFDQLPGDFKKYIKWINWQSISYLLLKLIEQFGTKLPNFDFAQDLYDLLDRKRLRNFQSFDRLEGRYIFDKLDQIFFSTEGAKFRGKFLGFANVLSQLEMNQTEGRLFYSRNFFNFKNYNLSEINEIFFSEKEK